MHEANKFEWKVTLGACSGLCCRSVWSTCILLGFLAFDSSLKITNFTIVPKLSRWAFKSSLQNMRNMKKIHLKKGLGFTVLTYNYAEYKLRQQVWKVQCWPDTQHVVVEENFRFEADLNEVWNDLHVVWTMCITVHAQRHQKILCWPSQLENHQTKKNL